MTWFSNSFDFEARPGYFVVAGSSLALAGFILLQSWNTNYKWKTYFIQVRVKIYAACLLTFGSVCILVASEVGDANNISSSLLVSLCGLGIVYSGEHVCDMFMSWHRRSVLNEFQGGANALAPYLIASVFVVLLWAQTFIVAPFFVDINSDAYSTVFSILIYVHVGSKLIANLVEGRNAVTYLREAYERARLKKVLAASASATGLGRMASGRIASGRISGTAGGPLSSPGKAASGRMAIGMGIGRSNSQVQLQIQASGAGLNDGDNGQSADGAKTSLGNTSPVSGTGGAVDDYRRDTASPVRPGGVGVGMLSRQQSDSIRAFSRSNSYAQLPMGPIGMGSASSQNIDAASGGASSAFSAINIFERTAGVTLDSKGRVAFNACAHCAASSIGVIPVAVLADTVLACMIYELLAVLALCLFSDCVASKTSSLQSCSLRMKMLMKNWLEKLQAPREAEQKNEGDTVSGRNIRERYLSSKIEVVNCVPQAALHKVSEKGSREQSHRHSRKDDSEFSSKTARRNKGLFGRVRQVLTARRSFDGCSSGGLAGNLHPSVSGSQELASEPSSRPDTRRERERYAHPSCHVMMLVSERGIEKDWSALQTSGVMPFHSPRRTDCEAGGGKGVPDLGLSTLKRAFGHFLPSSKDQKKYSGSSAGGTDTQRSGGRLWLPDTARSERPPHNGRPNFRLETGRSGFAGMELGQNTSRSLGGQGLNTGNRWQQVDFGDYQDAGAMIWTLSQEEAEDMDLMYSQKEFNMTSTPPNEAIRTDQAAQGDAMSGHYSLHLAIAGNVTQGGQTEESKSQSEMEEGLQSRSNEGRTGVDWNIEKRPVIETAESGDRGPGGSLPFLSQPSYSQASMSSIHLRGVTPSHESARVSPSSSQQGSGNGRAKATTARRPSLHFLAQMLTPLTSRGSRASRDGRARSSAGSKEATARGETIRETAGAAATSSEEGQGQAWEKKTGLRSHEGGTVKFEDASDVEENIDRIDTINDTDKDCSAPLSSLQAPDKERQLQGAGTEGEAHREADGLADMDERWTDRQTDGLRLSEGLADKERPSLSRGLSRTASGLISLSQSPIQRIRSRACSRTDDSRVFADNTGNDQHQHLGSGQSTPERPPALDCSMKVSEFSSIPDDDNVAKHEHELEQGAFSPDGARARKERGPTGPTGATDGAYGDGVAHCRNL